MARAVSIFFISWYCVWKYAKALSVYSPPNQFLYKFCTNEFCSGLLWGSFWYIDSNFNASSRGWILFKGLICAPPLRHPSN